MIRKLIAAWRERARYFRDQEAALARAREADTALWIERGCPDEPLYPLTKLGEMELAKRRKRRSPAEIAYILWNGSEDLTWPPSQS